MISSCRNDYDQAIQYEFFVSVFFLCAFLLIANYRKGIFITPFYINIDLYG